MLHHVFRSRPWLWFRVSLLSGLAVLNTGAAASYDERVPALRFAAAEIQKAAQVVSPAKPVDFVLEIDSAKLAPQCYRVERGASGSFRVIGGDAVGAMYGGLDLAEAVRLGTLDHLTNADHKPYIERRGIKFNIPLDLRTPSYSDNGDSFQANIPEVWSLEFWHEFLDEMARQRYNVLSLWNLHPFPSIVKVPEYPDIALKDVWRTRAKLDDTFKLTGSDMVRPYMLENPEVVKQLTIEQKIQFWRGVMQYAKDRGIDVYWFTWNIFVYGTEGKHGITVAQDNRTTIEYFRASVRETVLTYPLLAGLGITAGEQMAGKECPITKEQWLWQTYGEGIRDALKRQPGRQFRLIHRYHQTSQGEILRTFKDHPGPFDFSFKYSIAHMYSLTNPPFIQPVLAQMPPGMRTWLTVRNDDIYSFRWGDADYARDYLRAMPGPERLAGFYMGADGYCWGREFIDREPETPRQLVVQKQWYSFMLWGRLSYEPTLSNGFFERTLAARFPQVAVPQLSRAWTTASRIIPQATRFFWGDIDLLWFPEACTRHPVPRGFYTVKDFVLGKTMPGSGILTIMDWRNAELTREPAKGLTPLQVADTLAGYARETLALVGELRRHQGANKELRLTLGDCEAMAHLGDYYAEKIRAAANLALFDATRQEARQTAAVKHLEAALGHWQQYAAVATSQYRPQLLNRIGYVDLKALITQVEADVTLAKQWQPGSLKDAPRKSANADTPFKP